MKLQTELKKLKTFIGKDDSAFEKQLEIIKNSFKSEQDLKTIDEFIRSGLAEITSDLDAFNNDLNLKIKLTEASEIVSVSYIAKKYFNKTRSWLHQRINGNFVNGKSAKFTDEELKTLNYAFKDISEKLGSIRIS
ncbi:MAG: DUF5053 domain-containing protein [Bergeyella sp.]